MKPNLSFIDQIDLVDRKQWNACANPLSGLTVYNPFVSFDFLNALEKSKSATIQSGWSPQHLIMKDSDGMIKGAVPMYIKNHSMGEYVFDYNWADAYHQMGGHYYPKLQISVPFTPVNGPRILVHPDEDRESSRDTLIDACIQFANLHQISSIHVTFPCQDQLLSLDKHGFLTRVDQQYHWINKGYDDFDDFLSDLSSKKRKNIKRERRSAKQAGIRIQHLTGQDIQESHWDHFFDFYMDTGSRKWGSPYLTREFFSRIGETMFDQLLLFMCYRGDIPIAGALNILGGDCLYGRYWGCLEQHPFLHFEVCYYQAIEYAINNKLQRVEAGAQGEHKVFRGYVPTRTYSAHWFQNKTFHNIISKYLNDERKHIDEQILSISQYLPFRKSQN